MTKLNDIIAQAENRLEKINEQRKQNLAMQDILPARFERNINFMAQYLPDIAKKYRNYQPERTFEFFCTENGEPNLRWADSGDHFYGDSPFAECNSQLEQVLTSASLIRFNMSVEADYFHQQHISYMNKLVSENKNIKKEYKLAEKVAESIPLCLMFGIGLGYQLGCLYEKTTPANIFIFEPDADLFYASLFTFEWADLLSYILSKNLGVHFFIGQNAEEVILDLRAVVTIKNPFICATTFGFVHYYSEELMKLQKKVANEFYLLSMGWGFFDDNLFSLSHSLHNLENGVSFLKKNINLPDVFKKTPVFVVANGPSLDFSIDFIRENQDKMLVVACGTAVTALYRAGIKPDIYIAVERVTVVPNSLRSINATDFLKDILLIGPDILHPDCQQFFKQSIYALKADEPMFSLLFANTNITDEVKNIAFINPLVGNAGVSIPLHLGFERLYLAGLDNGFKSKEHHHSKYSMYYDEQGETKQQFKNMALAQGDHILPGNFGGEVISNSLFSASVMMLDVAVNHFPEAKCFNCSDGAAIKGAQPLDIQNVDFYNEPKIDKKEIIRILVEEMSAPVNINRADIQTYMDNEFFDYFIDKIKNEWSALPTERLLFVQMMQTQMDYLGQIAMSRQRHISSVLFGSFSSIFTLITHTLYAIDDENDAVLAVNRLQPIVLEFMDIIQTLYHRGLDMIQGKHF
jgi:hypothetical protein